MMAFPYIEAAEYIKSKTQLRPQTALVLGTGLGGIADTAEEAVVIPYGDIPGFPDIGGNWHKCRLVLGYIVGVPAAVMQGRLHYYEGYSMREAVFPVHMLKALGICNLVLTNASGAVNAEFAPGDVVLIEDHIKPWFDSPLRGRNPEELGERFFDMTNAYDRKLRDLAAERAKALGLDLKRGVYAYMAGPQFETPAEIRMLKTLGADLVGMSTVPEVIAAVHCGIRVLALSGVSNMAAGIENGGLNREVIDSAEPLMSSRMLPLLRDIIKVIGEA